jgi:general secretion pathway protein C
MVRGLVIRQLFLFLDVVLIGLIVFTVGLVLVNMVKTPNITRAATLDETAPEPPETPLLNDLQERVAYNVIKDNGLFGDAGRFRKEVAAAPVATPVADTGPLAETSLSLTLWGTTSLSPTSPYATASIEDGSKRERRLYRIGDAVVDQVTLEEVHQRWVILLNSRETPPKRERLSMDEDENGNPLASRSGDAVKSSRPTILPSEDVELDRKALVHELYENYADLVTKVKPELYRDASGNVAGITAPDIEEIPLAKTLGLQNGDVLQTVNNEQIDSQEKIMEMVQKYQRANAFRIGIMRNGKQKIITYNLR